MFRDLCKVWSLAQRSSRFQTRLALVLVCLLCSHWVLCTANSNIFRCDGSHAGEVAGGHQEGGPSTVEIAESHAPADRHGDICCAGTDETHVLTALVAFSPPIFTVTLVVWALLLLMLLPLAPGAAAMRGRDGPASIPYPAIEIIRACLPHRAPPVFLA